MNERVTSNRGVSIRWFNEVWNDGREDTIHELWAEGGVAHLAGFPPISREGFLRFHRALRAGFPDLTVTVLDALGADETVVVHWEMKGTQTGLLLGIPPTGRGVSETGITKLVIRGGRIAESWDTWNLGAMLDRLARPSIDDLKELHGLTDRQAEVAELMAGGLSAKRISRRLRISHNTARRHCQAVLRRLGIHRRGDVAEAIGRVRVSVSHPVSALVAETALS